MRYFAKFVAPFSFCSLKNPFAFGGTIMLVISLGYAGKQYYYEHKYTESCLNVHNINSKFLKNIETTDSVKSQKKNIIVESTDSK